MPQLSMHSPFGEITISEDDGRLVALDWGWGRDQEPTPLLIEVRDALTAYFDGEKVTFDFPLDPYGTDYCRKVWAALREIPYGATRSYADIARVAGGSARSVGQANGRNPLPILIPCHRVVAAGTKGRFALGGYSGGDGPETKRGLLLLEGMEQASLGL